jgi:Carboxypeptidase regulatory-like domain/TonB dependent receptor-like, beta-barrel/TonB-dependent Receptor Plug Domain
MHNVLRTFLAPALLLISLADAYGQVTTATLVGLVRDSSSAVIPGATVVATHEGTGVSREGVTDANGEFVFAALASGPYSVRIELTGFKTLQNRGMELGAGQTVRQTFTLEVGTLAETVTVAGEAPLIQTAMSLQADSLGSQEVRELPVNRRNIQNLIGLTAGVVITGTGAAGGSGGVQMNGVASGGTGITVDGTEANSNPEGRSLTQYGSENQISVMSLDSIAEVQIVKGVLPAEYGGVAGGQINVISRSGTNNFNGSAFYSGQNEKWNARDFFSTAQQPVGHFNQYGGTLGGPVLRNKVFFFGTYEGYREKVQLNQNTTVPYQAVRDEVLRALPYPETRIALDTLYLPTESIVSAAGVVNPQVGRWRGLGLRRRSENHIVAKTDMAVFNGANLSLTYTRLRPFTLEPRPNPDGVNDREFPNRQDRIAAQYVMTRGAWVSESRVGWNKAYLARLDKFLSVIGPNQPAEIMPYGRRVASFSISGLFGTAHSEILDMAGTAYSLEQKFSRGYQRHLVKAGFRFMRETGSHINPEDPAFTYQTYADVLANVVNSHNTTYGAPPHGSRMDQYGAFIQDDWRLGNSFVLNLGLRWDYYGVAQVYATTDVPVELVNLENPTDLRKMDFGPKRDPLKPYEPDGNNFGPRVGFAWTLGEAESTVIRGGLGYLYSPTLPMTVRQAVNHPTIPYRVVYNRTESAARNVRWPMYTDDALPLAQADSAGRAAVFSLIDTNISAPYTIQSMVSVQQAFGRTMAAEIGYIRTDGNDFPLQRQFTQAFDRQTGVRPNPAIGSPGGYYVDSSQTMVYNGLQTSVRRRFSNRYSWDVNYTLGKSESTQGGDLSVYYITSFNNIQDFWDPEFDYGPSTNDIRHRLNASFIYELPGVAGGEGFMNALLGGWQISGIFQARSGGAVTVTQPSGIGNSRPDVAPGVDLVVADWLDTCNNTGCNYLNPAGFVRVPVSPVTNATLRPGTYLHEMVRGPGDFNLHTTLAKSFSLGTGRRLQVRADAFNVLNRKNYNNPQTNMNNADFGRITGAGRARVFQLGARLTF